MISDDYSKNPGIPAGYASSVLLAVNYTTWLGECLTENGDHMTSEATFWAGKLSELSEQVHKDSRGTVSIPAILRMINSNKDGGIN